MGLHLHCIKNAPTKCSRIANAAEQKRCHKVLFSIFVLFCGLKGRPDISQSTDMGLQIQQNRLVFVQKIWLYPNFALTLSQKLQAMDFDITEIADFSGRMAHIYSVTLKGDEHTLLEHFFDENAKYDEEMKLIVQKLIVMGNDTGCRYEFFKHNEGALADGVAALRVGQIRLYCLYFDRTAVFFGSGGYKPVDIKAYQEDASLNQKAQQMRIIASRINKAIIEKDIEIKEDGSLIINYWEYEDD